MEMGLPVKPCSTSTPKGPPAVRKRLGAGKNFSGHRPQDYRVDRDDLSGRRAARSRAVRVHDVRRTGRLT